ncbi:hypothetical protein NE619_05645 [Anaerovorax odorimutans]|uniref:Sodium:solute symporter family protein n=1 Tax=Anaerovorax odorimutans TaxID=109327 RepID=A0ABT1RLZ6_9FIRM|nr:hypothetical protein [Anaerovorax odorimutans]MCQ4636204.1 hypothetical protein [Anaerovorax odorimutans]
MTGFLILIGYGLVLCLIYLYLKNKKRIDRRSVRNMIFAGGKAKDSTLIFSVLAAWMWTTSVFGASEAYLLYGIWGPLGYVVGACIAFGLFVPVLCSLRNRMPEAVTYLDFLEKRYSKRTKIFFYIFAFAVSAYVLIEQAVGVAYLLENLFGSSFKWAAFCSVMLAVAFICLGGMKGLLTSEKITSWVIIGGFAVLAVLLIRHGSPEGDPIKPQLEGSRTMAAVFIPAARYFVMAIVIAFGQLVFDPAYYIKGKLAADTRQLKKTYLIGGILLWGSLSLISSLYLGRASIVSSKDTAELFTGTVAVIFAIVITFIGISTVAHYLMGMLGIFATDYYKSVLRPQASEKEMLVFGRVMTVAIGVFCALVAISLEDISLLTIDVFCAIFFAAPCGPLIIGFLARKNFGNLPIAATSLGIIAGLLIWIAVPSDNQWDQFLGMAVSLCVPIILMMLGSLFAGKKTQED